MYSAIQTPLARLLAVALLGFGFSLATAQEPAKEPEEDHTAEFKTLDADFARLDELFVQYPDPVHKLTVLGYINLMKGRAEALGWNGGGAAAAGRGGRGARGGPQQDTGPGYGEAPPAAKPAWDQVKYDELRYDINLQAQRLANYMAPLRILPPPPPGTKPSVNVAKLKPSPTDAAEVKAALDALDYEIKKMETSAATIVMPKEREAEIARVNRVKERRAALGKEFTKARWDALVGDLK
jgi:hypothetical protein